MNKLLLIALPLALAGCATPLPCKDVPDTARADRARLLQENDLMQARYLIAARDPQGYPLAEALLARSAALDSRGEADFYQGLLAIRRERPAGEVLPALERAAARQHPHAIALLHKVYDEPYLVERRDPAKARHYRQAYGQLGVARSGYPSFEQALRIVARLVAQDPR